MSEQATTSLRFVKRPIEVAPNITKDLRILQQWWEISWDNGSVTYEWRDVEEGEE